MKEFIKTTEGRNTANLILQLLVAVALVGALFVSIWQVALGNLKADSAVVGSIFTMFIVLVNFCFPNSIGAQQAQDTISTLATANAVPITTTTTTTTEKANGQSFSNPEPAGDSYVAGSDTSAGTAFADDADYAPSGASRA